MTAGPIEYVYLETHDWQATKAFWTELGWSLVLDLGNAGQFDPPGGGTAVFVEQVPADQPLAQQLYLRFDDPSAPGFTPSHWDTELKEITDPDGRVHVLQRHPEAGRG